MQVCACIWVHMCVHGAFEHFYCITVTAPLFVKMCVINPVIRVVYISLFSYSFLVSTNLSVHTIIVFCMGISVFLWQGKG